MDYLRGKSREKILYVKLIRKHADKMKKTDKNIFGQFLKNGYPPDRLKRGFGGTFRTASGGGPERQTPFSEKSLMNLWLCSSVTVRGNASLHPLPNKPGIGATL